MGRKETMKKNDKPHRDSSKQEALDMALSSIEKQFGKGSIMRLGQSKTMQVEAIPTGSMALDLALGVGGLPRGRIVEIFGPEASGKTTLSMHVVAQAQKSGGLAAFVDAEHAFDPEYAKNLGINIDELLISQPDTGEQALEIVETLVRSNAIDVIVVDSVAALVPKVEIEGEMGDTHVGLQARLMSQALRKLSGIVSKTKTVVIFINQLRMKIGVMFGNPETTPGGMALKFYSSVRIDIRRIQQLKYRDEIIGSRTRIKIVKNKVAPPFRRCEFDIMYGKGVSRASELLELGLKYDILQKSGTWIIYGEEKIGQGREAAKNYFQEHKDVAKKIEKEVMKKAKDESAHKKK